MDGIEEFVILTAIHFVFLHHISPCTPKVMVYLVVLQILHDANGMTFNAFFGFVCLHHFLCDCAIREQCRNINLKIMLCRIVCWTVYSNKIRTNDRTFLIF